MKTEINLPLDAWCFGHTWYRSGRAEEDQYVLRVTKNALILRRKTEAAYPGLFLVFTVVDIPAVQVARDPTNEQYVLALNAELSEENPIVTTKWRHLAHWDMKAPARLFALFDSKETNLRQDWTDAMFLISKWTSLMIQDASLFVNPLNDPNLKVLVYPQPWVLEVCKRDIERLERSGWLNDIMVDLGLRRWYLRIHQENPALAEEIHITNTYFFDRIYRKGLRANYNKVKKWGKNMKVFERKYVVIPINQNNSHWYLAVICHPGRVLDAPPFQYPPLPALWRQPAKGVGHSSDLSKCTIVIMDSFGFSHTSCVRALRDFLQDEAEVYCGKKLDTREEGGRVEAIHLKVPEQKNSVDCGLYLLLFAEAFVAHADELLNSSTVFLKSVWLHYNIVGRREEFRKFVEEESDKWREENAKKNLDMTKRRR